MPNILRQMNLITRCAAHYRASRLCDTMPDPQFHSFVFAVCKNPGMSQDKLARHLCLNKSTVTRRLSQLEEGGYVTRTASEADRRALLVYPTEKMIALLPSIREVSHAWNQAVSNGISEDEMAVFFSVLERITCQARDLAGMSDTVGGEG